MRVRHAGPALVFAALAIVWTYPLVWHLGTHVPGASGDNYLLIWNFWWMRRALASPQLSFFHSPYLFAPDGFDLVNHPHTALQAGFAATVLGAVPLIDSLNMVILLSVFLTGLCSYLLAYDITSDSRAATLAGIIVAGSPYISAHMMGHFDLLSVWVLPLAALCLRRALATGRAAWMAAFGLAVAIAAYSAYYYVVYAALMAASLVATRFLIDRVPLARRRQTPLTRSAIAACLVLLAVVVTLIAWIAGTGGGAWSLGGMRVSMRAVQNPMTAGWVLLAIVTALVWRSPLSLRRPSLQERALLVRLLAWSVATFAVVAAPLIYLATLNAVQGRYVTQTYFWRSSFPGVDLGAFALGNPFHPWLRQQLADVQWFDRIEGVAWLGVVPVGLLLWRRRGWFDDQEARCWLAVLAIGVMWAVGPRLLLAGFDLGLPLPQSLARFIPIIDNARVPGRAMVIVYVSLGVLAAMRLAARKAQPLRPLTYWAAMLLVVADFLPAPIPLMPLDRPAIYHQLAALDDGRAVCPVPFGFGDGISNTGSSGRRILYYATLHGHPIVGGFIGRTPPAIAAEYNRNPTLARLLALSEDFPPPRVLADQRPGAANELPCRYVVLDRRIASSALIDFVAGLKLRLLASDDESVLYLNEPG